MIPFTQAQIVTGQAVKKALIGAGFTPAQSLLALAHICTETANFKHIVAPNNFSGIEYFGQPGCTDSGIAPPSAEHGHNYAAFDQPLYWAREYLTVIKKRSSAALQATTPEQYATALKAGKYMQAPIADVIKNFKDGYLKAQMYFS